MKKNNKYGRMFVQASAEPNSFELCRAQPKMRGRNPKLNPKTHCVMVRFKVLKVDKTMVDYTTKLSDFHAQFRAIGTNYNQVVKELRCHFSEKKAMALLYKLESCTIELVKLSREIVELSREIEKCYQSKSD